MCSELREYEDIYPIDRRIMFCKKCGKPLKWNMNFDKLICVNCHKEHNPIEIRDRMWKDENSFTEYDYEYLNNDEDEKGDKKKKNKFIDENGMLTVEIKG